MPKFKAHLFVCTNDRGPNAKRESCCSKGAQELRDKIKIACKERGLPKDAVRVNNAGCLDQCERGIAAVLYPKGEWFLNLTPNDVDRLVDTIEEACKDKNEEA